MRSKVRCFSIFRSPYYQEFIRNVDQFEKLVEVYKS